LSYDESTLHRGVASMLRADSSLRRLIVPAGLDYPNWDVALEYPSRACVLSTVYKYGVCAGHGPTRDLLNGGIDKSKKMSHTQ